ncbi:hypothetical protein M404DRAFT_998738 [Pisolithus tinctorius Marx 270]|uniref:Uncharacterized protein n=1 Tax=Pisolithus tinctorius Marx 270 TaxID=870435 RepID=A0A0C3PFB8_PISTI|nr:hypothetical protein M404DRAFT_998738 [Pisolithus tinctorius Marx 270]
MARLRLMTQESRSSSSVLCYRVKGDRARGEARTIGHAFSIPFLSVGTTAVHSNSMCVSSRDRTGTHAKAVGCGENSLASP